MPRYRVEKKETRVHVWNSVEAESAEDAIQLVFDGAAGESDSDQFDSEEVHGATEVET